MKKVYLILMLVLSLSFVLSAQETLSIEPAIVQKQITIGTSRQGQDEVMKVVVTNTSGRTLRLRWDKNVVYQPYIWESQICDKEASYPPAITSNYDPLQGVLAPVVLRAGERFELFVTMASFNVKGQGKTEIIFREIERPEKILGTATFQLNLIDIEDRARMSRAGERTAVYPNPVHDRFFLDNLPPEVTRIDIYNTLGGKVRSFSNPQAGDSFEAGDLPQGVYLLSLVDRNGKAIRTLRLLRRDFRP